MLNRIFELTQATLIAESHYSRAIQARQGIDSAWTALRLAAQEEEVARITETISTLELALTVAPNRTRESILSLIASLRTAHDLEFKMLSEMKYGAP